MWQLAAFLPMVLGWAPSGEHDASERRCAFVLDSRKADVDLRYPNPCSAKHDTSTVSCGTTIEVFATALGHGCTDRT